ncbi:hypothetical protein [Legionella nagasakiensis]|uniref:hypothetical protein n=1 Tax=Legionella nagasakiensis TaxID=535290 RepID=UPI00105473AE|nr:hypothetical protein [Legionella nagasakiensis]
MSYGKPTARSKQLKLSPPKRPLLTVPKTSQESLSQLHITQQQISDIKRYLNAIIASLQDDTSLITKAANVWGKIPTWQKIVIGIGVFGALIALGVFAQLMILTIIGSLGGIGYLGASLLLDDHYSEHKQAKENLKNGVYALVDLFDTIIQALNKIRMQLTQEIEHFQEENTQFKISIQTLNEEITVLGQEVRKLSTTQQALHITEHKLSRLHEEYQQTKEALQEKINELAQLQTASLLEIEKLRKINLTLQSTIQVLSNTVIEDEAQRREFLNRLETFLADSTASFHLVADRICEAERELARVKEELKLSNQRYAELLDKHAAQLSRLERLGKIIPLAFHEPATTSPQIKLSIYNHKASGMISKTPFNDSYHEQLRYLPY